MKRRRHGLIHDPAGSRTGISGYALVNSTIDRDSMAADALGKWHPSEQAGVRATLTYPSGDQAASFYRRFDFVPSPVQEAQWLLLLKDVRAALKVERPAVRRSGPWV